MEPDARFGRKSKSKTFYGYKNHIAMTEEEIITAIEVTAGNEDDGKQLPSLVDKTKDQQITIEEVLADTAYSRKDNLSYLQKEKIKASIPQNPYLMALVKMILFSMIKKMMKSFALLVIQVLEKLKQEKLEQVKIHA